MADQIFPKNGGKKAQLSAESDQPSFLRLSMSTTGDSSDHDRFHHQNQMPKRVHRKPNPQSPSSSLFDLLGGARSNDSRKRNVGKLSHVSVANYNASASAGLSTEELVRIAGARFIQSSSSDSRARVDNLPDLSFSGLSDQEVRNVELAEFLLTAAEKIGDEQFERARSLLTECDLQSSPTGDPVQRLAYYFSRALVERIDRQTGKETGQKPSPLIRDVTIPPSECFIEYHEKVPFGQVSQFAAIQAVVDGVANATRIHIVDFNIKNGKQWTILMQALVSREENRVDHLKITAIGTSDTLEETGKRLADFAQTMALPFSFRQITVGDYVDLTVEMFEVDCEETVAVSAEYLLTTLIQPVEKLDSVMKVIWTLSPCVMVVTEIESNNNSPVFVNRFIESLFYTSAFFDCLEVCMDRDSPNRKVVESRFFGEGIRVIVAEEGEERVIRNVKMEAWRAYFGRFRMKEAELSFSCMYQAELVARKYPSWKFCSVGLDGKSLIVGWKGTPIHSVTAWNFDSGSSE